MALVLVLISAGAAVGVVSGTAAAATCVAGPTTDVYTPSSGNSGDWNVAANWSLTAVPSGTEVACWNAGTTVIVSDAESVDSIQADGNLMITTGDLTLTSASNSSSVGNLEIDGGGTLNGGSQSMTVLAVFTWGGGVAGAATLNSTAIIAGSVTMDNTSTPTFGGGSVSTTSPVTLSTNLTVSGTTAFSTSSAITADGTVTGTGGTFTAAGVIAGTTGTYGFGTNSLTLTGGTTTVASGNTLTSGALAVQGGTLEDDGTLNPTSMTLTGGTLDGTGTVAAAVANTSGTVSPGDLAPGVLTISGNYTQGSSATLAVDIGGASPGTGYGQLSVQGTAAVAGHLALTDTGGFTPTPSDTFLVVTSTGARTGTFTLGGSSASLYSAQYGANGVTLVAPPANCPASNFDAYVASSGNWSTAGNWSTGAVPTGTEVACWATGTVVTVSDAESANSIQGGDLAVANGGAFTFTGSGSSNVDNLTLDGGGDLEGPSTQTLTVGTSFDWGGSGSGTAALNTSPGKGLKISTVALTIDGTTSAPTFGGGSINTGSSPVSITNSSFTTAGAPGSPTLITTSAITLGTNVDVGGSAGSFTAAGVVGPGSGTYGFGSNSLTLTGGSTTVASGTTLDTGSLSLTGGMLTNDGTVDVGGNYVQGSGGTLALNISGTTPGTQYGQLTVQGTASVAGHLSLTDTGGFTPTSSDTFSILISTGTRTGTFTLSGTNAGTYSAQYGANGVTLLAPPANCPASNFDAYIGTSGTWSTAANWSTGALPTSTQVACWATGTDVTVDGPSDTAASIEGGDLTIGSPGVLTLKGSGSSSVDNLFLDGGGSLDGPSTQTLTVGTTFDWGGSGTGSAALNTTGGTGLKIVSATLTIDGTTSTPTFGGGSINAGASPVSITNPAFTVSGSPTLTTTSTITLGTGVNVAGSGGSFTAAGVVGPASGTYGFGTNSLTLTGGTTTVASGQTLDTGSLSLTGGTLQNNGTISVTGNYSQSGGTLALDITGTTAGTQFGQLHATGTAALGGSLSLTDTSFTPAQSNTFPILTSTGTRSGTFTLSGPNATTYLAQYGANGVTLAVKPTTCPASTFDAYTAPSGNWSTAASWSTGALPTSGEVACWATGTTVTSDGTDTAASVEGGNLTVASPGVLTLGSGSSTVDTLSLEGGGTLNGPSTQTLTVGTNFDWGGSGSGAAKLNTAGTGVKITTGPLTIDGTTSTPTFGGGSINAGASPVSITNPAFTVSGSPTLTTTSTITLGTGVNVAGSGGSFTAAGVVGPASGTYGFGTNSLTLTGGTTTVASGQTLDTGSLSLTGGTLQNNGTISVTGNYSQSGGTLALDITGTTAGTQFGQLHATGTAALGGSLSLTDTSFTPAQSNTFPILTSTGTRTGIFTVTSASVFVVGYNPNNVTLSINPAPVNIQAPTITGTPSVGQTLTCAPGTWSNEPPTYNGYTYQWNRDGSAISGAASATYVVVTADQGHTLTCTATATNGSGSGKAVSAGVSVPAGASPPPPPPPGSTPAPVNSAAPAVSGTPTPGNHLSCANGTWSNSPTAFTYQWKRNGSPIAGATGPSYTVQIADENASLTCTVAASNAGGAGTPSTSASILVAIRGTLSCGKPTGKLSGRTLGPLKLGFRRVTARKAVKKYTRIGSSVDNFCLYGGWGIHAGYPTAKLLGSVSAAARARLRGKVVLALTSNLFYALNGARPGMKLTAVAKKLHLGKVIHIGSNDWYIAPGSLSRGVLRVRNGIVQEVGIGVSAFTNTRSEQRRFLAAFNSA